MGVPSESVSCYGSVVVNNYSSRETCLQWFVTETTHQVT